MVELDALAAEVRQIEGVDDVRTVTQREALVEVREILGPDSPMADQLTEAQIPARLDVQVVNDEALARLRMAMEPDGRVQEVLDDRLRPAQVSATLRLTVERFSAEMNELEEEGPSELREHIAAFAAAADRTDPLTEADLPALVEAFRAVKDFVARNCGTD